ncbi:hypothetical protein KY348_00190 [Candidatus Woesearchaeota archaeon]|nr:hypothetical protein [Candidatus Woesearchaeota archaeon]
MIDENYILTKEKLCFHHTKIENIKGILAEGLKPGSKHDENGDIKEYYKLYPNEPERIFVVCFDGENTEFERNYHTKIERNPKDGEREKKIISLLKPQDDKIWLIISNDIKLLNREATYYANAVEDPKITPDKIIAIVSPNNFDNNCVNLDEFSEVNTSKIKGKLLVRNCPDKIKN